MVPGSAGTAGNAHRELSKRGNHDTQFHSPADSYAVVHLDHRGAVYFIGAVLMYHTVNFDYHLYNSAASFLGGWDFTWHYAVYTWVYTVLNVFRWLMVPFLVAVTAWQCIKAAHHVSTTTSHV